MPLIAVIVRWTSNCSAAVEMFSEAVSASETHQARNVVVATAARARAMSFFFMNYSVSAAVTAVVSWKGIIGQLKSMPAALARSSAASSADTSRELAVLRK